MDEKEAQTLWCGNLAPEVTEEILYELFLQAGPIERVNIPKDRDGKNRTYGFITFKHNVSVFYAKEMMGGIKLYGRALRLQSRSGSNSEPGAGADSKSLPNNLTINPEQPNLTHELGNLNEIRDTSSNGREKRKFRDDSFNKGHFYEQRQYDRHTDGFINSNSTPIWQNAYQTNTFCQGNFSVDKSSIFDPVLEQKMRERLMIIHQEDQFKMMQQNTFTPNMAQLQHSYWHRSNNWWN